MLKRTIRGLTDDKPQFETSSMLAAKVYLGKRQIQRQKLDKNKQPILDAQGKPTYYSSLAEDADLKTLLRIQPLSEECQKVLSKAYRVTPDTNGDLIVDHLNVIPMGDRAWDAFPTSMKVFTAKKLVLECDRTQITGEFKEYKDQVGHTRGRLFPSDKPCAMNESSHAFEGCPNGCKPSGTFHFYIKELRESDYAIHLPCQLTVVGATNFRGGGIWDSLNQFYDLYCPDGALESLVSTDFFTRTVPYPLGSKMLCRLSRKQENILRPVLKDKLRTGEKAKGIAYPLMLTIDPEWEAHWMEWKYRKNAIAQLVEFRNMGFLPGKQLMHDAGIVQIIDVTPVNTIKSLPPARITGEQIMVLSTILKSGEIHKSFNGLADVQEKIKREFNVPTFYDLYTHQFDGVKEFLLTGEISF
jgi:hypothetical protein